MKMSLKKLLFTILTVFSIIFIGACGKSEPVSKEEIIKNFVAASENIKSGDVVANVKMIQNFNGNKVGIDMIIDASIIREPLAAKMKIEIPSQNTKVNSYIKDNVMYVQNPVDNQWFTQPLDAQITNQYKDLIVTEQVYDVIKNNVDKIDVDEKDGNYIISISKDSEFLKEAMKNQLINSNTIGVQAGNNVKIENIAVEYIIDKKTFLPFSSAISFEFEMQGMRVSSEANTKISNINNVGEIVIPKEAENAKKVLGN
ncbi:DUF6612 family protein [Fusobacterium canifelinum]|uniref:Lipoprotein n=1 Tax=Fusobacterium canifelinum TaxID=285729 RepID=A0A3P1V421_9FUSO|nr:DUF6612 family protein [Fusobacterium canifelinum]RRD28457.1 hypothetical protein EII27_02225 [Fusobacterium canifelinum]